MVKVKNDEFGDELLKCCIQAKMNDDTFIVYIDKLAEKRLVPWAHLRPLHSASLPPSSHQFSRINRNGFDGDYWSRIDRFAYDSHDSNKKSRVKCQRLDDLMGVCDYRAAICNSAFDLEPYVNLSNFASNTQRELFAYPIYSHTTGNMTKNNGNNNSGNAGNSGGSAGNAASNGNPTGNVKLLKNRQQQQQQSSTNQTNEGDNSKSQMVPLKIDTDNNGVGGSGAQYGKAGVHESKIDSQPLSSSTTSSSSTTATGHQQTYHQHQHHQMAEQNANVDASTGMAVATVAEVSHPHMSSYYHQGAATAAPVYYYQTAADDQGIYSTSDMVMQPGVYAVPAAYQHTTTAHGAPPMQPGMYAPVISSTQAAGHYPLVNSWPTYAQPMNPQGRNMKLLIK